MQVASLMDFLSLSRQSDIEKWTDSTSRGHCSRCPYAVSVTGDAERRADEDKGRTDCEVNLRRDIDIILVMDVRQAMYPRVMTIHVAPALDGISTLSISEIDTIVHIKSFGQN